MKNWNKFWPCKIFRVHNMSNCGPTLIWNENKAYRPSRAWSYGRQQLRRSNSLQFTVVFLKYALELFICSQMQNADNHFDCHLFCKNELWLHWIQFKFVVHSADSLLHLGRCVIMTQGFGYHNQALIISFPRFQCYWGYWLCFTAVLYIHVHTSFKRTSEGPNHYFTLLHISFVYSYPL